MFITNIGIPGTILLLLGSFLIIAIFTSKKTIPFLQCVFSLGWVRNRLKREKKEDEVEVEQTQKEDVVTPRSKPVVEQPDEQPEMDDYEEFDTEAELLEAEGKENRKTEPEYQEEEVAGDDLVVTIAKGDDDPICEKTDEINTPESEDGEDAGFTVEVAAGNDETYDASALGTYDPRLDLSRYVFPTLDLLKAYDSGSMEINRDELAENQRLIKQALEDFNIKIASIKATVGPTVTLYEIVPEAGVRISTIKNLEDDIALVYPLCRSVLSLRCPERERSVSRCRIRILRRYRCNLLSLHADSLRVSMSCLWRWVRRLRTRCSCSIFVRHRIYW